jgi:hypothetical protein
MNSGVLVVMQDADAGSQRTPIHRQFPVVTLSASKGALQTKLKDARKLVEKLVLMLVIWLEKFPLNI